MQSFSRKKIDIPADWTAGDLHDHMMEAGAKLIVQTVSKIAAGNYEAQAQDHSQYLNPAPKIFKEDCKVNWDQDIATIHNFVRGLSPYPTAWTKVNGKTLKLFKTNPEFTETTNIKPGTIVCDGKAQLKIAGKNGFLHI